jgi:hypothetical protein
VTPTADAPPPVDSDEDSVAAERQPVVREARTDVELGVKAQRAGDRRRYSALITW